MPNLFNSTESNYNLINFLNCLLRGVYSPRFCSPSDLDHAVLMIGYGVEPKSLFHKETPYWIIKNTWGNKWGESGTIKKIFILNKIQ